MKTDLSTKQSTLKKASRIVLISLMTMLVGVSYQNCSKSDVSSADMSSSSLSSFSNISSEDDLFNMLQEAREIAALLKSYDLSADPDSDVLRQAPTLARKLIEKADMIERAVTVDLIPTNSNAVLKEVDSLVNLLAQGRDVRVAYDSIRRDKLLALRIDQIENSLNETIKKLTDLGGAFNAFKGAITARVDGLVEQMGKWENRADAIDKAIADLATKNKAEDLLLKQALEELKKYTQNELADVKENSQKLESDIKKQAEDALKTAAEIKKAQDELTALGSISNRLCLYNDKGEIADTRTKCTSSSQGGGCCLTVEVIDCNGLFRDAPAAANQCQLLVSVIKNHDQQLQAIKAVDEKQNAAIEQMNSNIDSIIKDVTTLNNNVKSLADGVDKIKAVTDELANQVGSIKEDMAKNDAEVKARLANLDMRVMLLELKSDRTEVIAGLQSRANATLAWATLRYAQINSVFCDARRNQALAQFDYKAARQNIEFCHQKRAHAVLAQSMANVALSYANLLGTIKLGADCTEKINNKTASALTNNELLNDDILKQVTTKCQIQGGEIMAKAMVLNIVRYLKQIGPDHRTYEAMGATTKAVNIAFFGKEHDQVPEADRIAFDNIDPTSDALKNTPYGEVERLFVHNFYASAFRDANGKFIFDPTKVNVKVSGSIYTEKQLLDGQQVGKNMADYVRRVRDLEVEGFCNDCGFKIAGRNNPDSNRSSLVVVPGKGKSRFIFPNDPQPDLCPVDDQVVIRHKDGKHYVYNLRFDSWGNDILTPFLYRGGHVVIANSDEDMRSGNFNSCGYEHHVLVERAGLDLAQIPTRLTIRATRPYGQAYGRPHCTKLTAVCALKDEEWIVPSGMSPKMSDMMNPATQVTFARYLTGFDSSVVNYMCQGQSNKKAVGAPDPVYSNSRSIAHIINSAWSNPDGQNASSRAQGYVEDKSTQLIGTSYWPFQDGPLPYTAEKIMMGIGRPFAAVPSSSALTSTRYIREADPISDIRVEECSHCPASLQLLGGCPVLPPPKPEVSNQGQAAAQ